MKQMPMLFSAPMIRALLEGRKTQTRRLKFSGKVGDVIWVRETWKYHDWSEDGEPWIHYRADDVKIFHAGIGEDSAGAPLDKWEILSDPENYDIDNRASDRKWRSSIHMPRWASRIQLRVTAVRKELLQSISEADAIVEGVNSITVASIAAALENCDVAIRRPAGLAFRDLWQSIHGEDSWYTNPAVFVIEFERVQS